MVLLSAYEFFSNNTNQIDSQKISAIKSGFSPLFAPTSLLSLNKTPEIYPLASLPYKSTYLTDEGYGLITYKADRFGFRNIDETWNDVLVKTNIFLIGDSFVQGYSVQDDATIPANIEESTNLKTINLGIGGNGPYEYMAILKSIIKPINEISNLTRIVVLIFYGNDNINKDLKREYLLERVKSVIEKYNQIGIIPNEFYRENIEKIITSNYPQTSEDIIRELNKKRKNPWLSNRNFKDTSLYSIASLHPLRKKIGLTNFADSYTPYEYSPSKNSILLLSKICKNSCKPIVAFIPSRTSGKNLKKDKIYKNKLKETAQKINLIFIDGEEVINRNIRENYAPGISNGHLSIEGYKKISDLISERINLGL